MISVVNVKCIKSHKKSHKKFFNVCLESLSSVCDILSFFFNSDRFSFFSFSPRHPIDNFLIFNLINHESRDKATNLFHTNDHKRC